MKTEKGQRMYSGKLLARLTAYCSATLKVGRPWEDSNERKRKNLVQISNEFTICDMRGEEKKEKKG